MSWRGRGDLKNLARSNARITPCDSVASPVLRCLSQQAGLLPARAHTAPEVFDAYARALWRWRTATPELPLRRFEFPAAAGAPVMRWISNMLPTTIPRSSPICSAASGRLSFVACERAPDPRTLFLGAPTCSLRRGDSIPLPLAAGRPNVSAGWRCRLSWQTPAQGRGAVFKAA